MEPKTFFPERAARAAQDDPEEGSKPMEPKKPKEQKTQKTPREYEAEIRNLQNKLKLLLVEQKKNDQHWGEKVQEQRDENVRLDEQLKREKKKRKKLKETIRKLDYRVARLVEANESATDAAGSIARVTRSLGMCLDTLELKLDRENKDAAKASRFPR